MISANRDTASGNAPWGSMGGDGAFLEAGDLGSNALEGAEANRDTRGRIAPRASESRHGLQERDPWAGRRSALRKHITRARKFRTWLEGNVVENAAEIAKREKLTRARVSQLMRLLDLAPRILADLEDAHALGPVPTEVELRRLAKVKSPERQWAQYHQLCASEGATRRPTKGATRTRPPQRGLQHLIERARRYYAAMEAGEYASLAELGRAEGVTGRRVSQILRLLYLEPEILAAVDVPAEELPMGVTERRLREVSKIVGREGQMAAWRELVRWAGPRGETSGPSPITLRVYRSSSETL